MGDGSIVSSVSVTSPVTSPIELSLDAHQAAHFNSQDLESGNASKGLSGGFGDGAGNWRLTVSADQPLQVMSLMQSATGHLTNLSR